MSADAGRPIVVYHHRTQGVDAQGIHVFEMCKAFEALGYTVVKVAPHAQEQVGRDTRPGFLSRMASSLPPLAYELLELGYNLVGIPRLYRAVRAHRPVFVYERYSLYNLCGVAVSRLTGTPLTLEVNSPLAWERSRHGRLVFARLAQFLETFIVNRATWTVAVSGVLKAMLVERGGRPESIVVMHNAVNPEDYRLPSPSRPDPEAPVTLGFTGWFKPWHGLSEMIRSLDDHGLFRERIRLLLVGDGPARPDLERLIAQRALGDTVTITGAVDRPTMGRLLASMDIALQPAATPYASPMKLFEYLAAGKAVVAPNQANIREVVRHGAQALLFAPGDWDEFALKVRELVRNRNLRSLLGAAGRRAMTENRRTWRDNAARVARLFAEHHPTAEDVRTSGRTRGLT